MHSIIEIYHFSYVPVGRNSEEEQNSKDLISQLRTSGVEDTELTRTLKSCKVCSLQLDISRGWSLATTTSGQAHHVRERTSSSTSICFV